MLNFAQHPEHIQAIIAAALKQADPHTAVTNHLHKMGSQLTIGSHQFDLANGRLYIISVGKAAVPMALAAVDIVGETAVAGGGILAKHLPAATKFPLPAYESNHPVPGEKSIESTKKLLQTLHDLTENDLVLCLISGGASALFTQPLLPLEVMQEMTEALLASGCTIQELNTVRRQFDHVKGGGLAQLAAPAYVISLILSDVVGNDLAAIGSGPTVSTSETAANAVAVLERYKVLNGMETAVAKTIQSTFTKLTQHSTPSPTNILDNIIIGSIQQSVQAAAAKAEELGFHTRLLTTRLEGEARKVGHFASALAKDAPPQSATLLGGETTVTLCGDGIGGRNLETALAASIGLAGWTNRTITSFATDGDDGTSGVAGATVTGQTVADRQTALAYLNNNDSYTYFAQRDAAGNGRHLIKTGPTGTNVNDLIIILNYEGQP
ncbi:glycerate kinase type-2 family protein [Candidatus Leptofilum sp.]|uniref:glycerate kinase type-2 family protein n=1 Tax=Candidatus Leptofilum sp. TaxID=3241576 RepID=UPI003B5A20F9